MSLMASLSALFSSKARSQGDGVTIVSASTELSKELARQTSLGLDLMRRYVGEKTAYSTAEIDSAVAAWRASADPAKESPDLVVERVGAFFGAHLIAKLELEWAVYGDERGKDLCVVDKKLSVFSFPHSAIYKATVQGREEALPNVEAALIEQIAEAAKNPGVKTR
jgi:hypothetical protein